MASVERSRMIALARESVEDWVLHERPRRRGKSPGISERIEEPSVFGIFVTIYKNGFRGRELRGCIGRFERRFDALADEIADVAILSAGSDPRFGAVVADELDRLEYEISLLRAPEDIDSAAQLDPQKYGVIMSDGIREATLLPEIEGVDTVEKQLAIVRQKAGIPSGAPVTLQRYAVEKVVEPERG